MSQATTPRKTGITPGTGRYPELTSLRAIAAIAVVATHSAFWTGHYRGDWALAWARLDFGVALFFTLSGFLLFRPWVSAAFRGDDPPSAKAYARKRAVRILPGYWLVVIAAFALVPSPNGHTWAGWLRSMTFTQVYGGAYQHRGLTQMWSLCVEVAFYIALPLLGWLACRVVSRGGWRPVRLALLTLGFGLVAPLWYVVTREFVTFDISSIFWPFGYADWFAAGMALAIAAVAAEGGDARIASVARGVAAAPYACWTFALALLVIAATPAAGEATLVPIPLFDALAKNLLYAAAAGLVLAPLVLGGSGTTATAWLRWRPLTWLGEISYELFLVHLIVIEGALNVMGYQTFTGSMGYVFVLTTAASIPLAWLLKLAVDWLAAAVTTG